MNAPSGTDSGRRDVDWENHSRLFYSTLRVIVTLIVKARLIPMTVEGQENIPSRGGTLLIANHQSNLDPLLISWASQRPMSIPGKRELYQIPVFGWLLRKLGSYPIDRESRDPASLRQTLKALRSGRIICLFPESTRTKSGEVGEFEPTVAKIGMRDGVVVIPCAINGSGKVLGRGRIIPRLRTRVTVRFGARVDLTTGGDGVQPGDAKASAVLLRSRVASLL